MTSVKEVLVDEPAESGLGRGRFRFSDAYSVFDWGQMPDPIAGKGASLCTMGADNFHRLEAAGIPTHYRGVVSGDAVVSLEDCPDAPTEMAIDLARVPPLPADGTNYDYPAYHEAAGDYFVVPLEIVFRNTVPVGSSLRRRTAPRDHGLAFDEWPAEAVDLDEPIVEYSTKYEEQDRYLDRGDADRIAGAADIDDLEQAARAVNRLVTERAAEVGFTHQDGKIECLYADGEIRVADVVGTFDENRFAYDGQQLSKEVLRQYYKRHHPDWVDAVSTAKTEAKRRDVTDWRPLCTTQPPALPAEVVNVASDLYRSGANAYTGREFFDAPALEEAVAAVRSLSST